MNILRTSALSYVVYADADSVYGVMTCDVCPSDLHVQLSITMERMLLCVDRLCACGHECTTKGGWLTLIQISFITSINTVIMDL